LIAQQCYTISACEYLYRGNHFDCPLPPLSPRCARYLLAHTGQTAQQCAVAPSPPPSPMPAPPPWTTSEERMLVTLFVGLGSAVLVLAAAALAAWRYYVKNRHLHNALLKELEMHRTDEVSRPAPHQHPAAPRQQPAAPHDPPAPPRYPPPAAPRYPPPAATLLIAAPHYAHKHR
jgi:hypothetical protein